MHQKGKTLRSCHCSGGNESGKETEVHVREANVGTTDHFLIRTDSQQTRAVNTTKARLEIVQMAKKEKANSIRKKIGKSCK